MTTLDLMRQTHQALINENLVSVTVHRVEYLDDAAGGRYKRESDLPAFIGRLVPGQSRQVIDTEAGQVQEASMLLLAPWDADVRAGSDVQDTFTANGRSYRVRQVTPRRWQGEVYGVQAALEEVG